jgi:hypothetical protein
MVISQRLSFSCKLFFRNQFSLGEFMSAPSRRPEIRRRRTRNEKIVKLRKRLAGAASESDRTRLTAKLARLAQNSPGQPLVKA